MKGQKKRLRGKVENSWAKRKKNKKRKLQVEIKKERKVTSEKHGEEEKKKT